MIFSLFFMICTKLKNVDISKDRVQKPCLRGPLAGSGGGPVGAQAGRERGPRVPGGIKGGNKQGRRTKLIYHALGQRPGEFDFGGLFMQKTVRSSP